MGSAVLSGSDTLVIDDHVFNDFADGNVAEITFPNDISNLKTGKNGNTIYGLNESGRHAEFKVKVLRGSTDDKFLNGKLAAQQNNFAGFPLMVGTFVKKLGDGTGNITSDTYICSGGVFTKIPEAKSNVEGDTDQSTVIYTIKFSNAPRAIT